MELKKYLIIGATALALAPTISTSFVSHSVYASEQSVQSEEVEVRVVSETEEELLIYIGNSEQPEITTYAAQKGKPQVKYLGKKEILAALNTLDKNTNWLRYANTPLTSALLGKATKLITKSSFIGALGSVVSWATMDLIGRQKDWWKETALLVLQGKIKGVKYTFTPNVGTGYPLGGWHSLKRY